MHDQDYCWIYDGKPKSNGWYATLHCYDVTEGVIPSAEFFGGDQWHWSITAFVGPFQDEKHAKDWAYHNDPESQLKGN